MATIISEDVGNKTAFSGGTIAIDATGFIVTLSGATYDANWGLADSYDLDTGGTPETRLVASRDSDTQLTLQIASTKTSQSGLSHQIQRAFATVSSAEAATDNDLVAADEQRDLLLSADTTYPLATTVNIDGATTDATRFRRFRGHPRDTNLAGQPGDFVLMTNANFGFFSNGSEGFIDISYLEMSNWGKDGSAGQTHSCVEGGSATSPDCDSHHLIMHDPSATSVSSIEAIGHRVLNMKRWKVHHNLVYKIEKASHNSSAGISGNDTNKIYNNIVFDAGRGIRSGTDPDKVSAWNNISVGNSINDYEGAEFDQDDCFNNIDSDGTAPGKPNLTTVQTLDGTLFNNTGDGVEDFRLPVGSDARNRGVGPGLDSRVISPDLANNTISGNVIDIGCYQASDLGKVVSIGADEFLTTAIPVFMYNYRKRRVI